MFPPQINELLREAAVSAGDNVRFLDCSPDLLAPFAPKPLPGSKEPETSAPPLSAEQQGVEWVDREIFGDYLHLTPEGCVRRPVCAPLRCACAFAARALMG